MLQEVIDLETLRQKIATEEETQEEEYDVDGRPNTQLSRAAKAKIAASKNRSAEMRAQLAHMIDSVRKNNPSALEEWVAWHKSLLSPIVAETAKDGIGDTRINMARYTLEKWEKVLSGEQDYVFINRHFLKDYHQELRKHVKQDSGEGWKFWK